MVDVFNERGSCLEFDMTIIKINKLDFIWC